MHGATEVDPYSDEFVAEPWKDLALIRDAAPAVWLDGYGVWAIARHVDVMAALRHDKTNSSSHDVGHAYLAAGADFIETNTFTTAHSSQADYGLSHLVSEMCETSARSDHSEYSATTEVVRLLGKPFY